MNEKLVDAAKEAGRAEGYADAGDDATWAASVLGAYVAHEHWGWIGAVCVFALAFWILHRHYYAKYAANRTRFDSMLSDEQENKFRRKYGDDYFSGRE